MSDYEKAAREQAAALRAIADMLDAQPELGNYTRFASGINMIHVPVSYLDDPRAAIAAFVRAGMAHGASVTKRNDDKFGGAVLTWGPVSLEAFATREQVCERVVVGTKEITEEVPDPEALAAVPKVERTRTEEIVEWRCQPLLAPSEAVDAGSAVAS